MEIVLSRFLYDGQRYKCVNRFQPIFRSLFHEVFPPEKSCMRSLRNFPRILMNSPVASATYHHHHHDAGARTVHTKKEICQCNLNALKATQFVPSMRNFNALSAKLEQKPISAESLCQTILNVNGKSLLGCNNSGWVPVTFISNSSLVFSLTAQNIFFPCFFFVCELLLLLCSSC